MAAALMVAAPLVVITSAQATTSATRGDAVVAVSKLSGVPTKVAPGSRLQVTTAVRSSSTRKATTYVTFHLSKDAKLDGKDARLARSKSVRLRPKATATVTTSLTLPKSAAPGSYHVLACVVRSCKATKTTLRRSGAPSSPPTNGTLTGVLTLAETETRENWTRIDRAAQVTVAMSWRGPFATNNDFTSTGSTYSYTGELRQDPLPADCTVTTVVESSGGGTLVATGDPDDDQMTGSIVYNDLSKINVGAMLPFSGQRTVKADGGSTCVHSTTTTPVSGLDILDIDLTESSRTATDITYRVSALRGPYATETDWDSVSGTLTLHLG